MAKYLLLLLILNIHAFNIQDTTTLIINFKSIEKQNNYDDTIRLFFYNGIDSIKVSSTKCIDTIKINKKLKGLYYLDIKKGSYSSIKNIINFDSTGIAYIEKTFGKNENNIIEEIVITKNNNPPVVSKGNKISFSISNNNSLNNNSVFETILKLPGVFNGIGGGITVNGKPTSILIDGLQSSYSGDDLTNYLNSISSANIQKIEIISNPGVTFDSNTSNTIINIITLKNNKKGIGGIFNANTTFYIKEKYQSSLVLNGSISKFNWNLTTNYSIINAENSNDLDIYNGKQNENLINTIFNKTKNKPKTLETSFSYLINEEFTTSFKYSFNNSKDLINSITHLNLNNNSKNINLRGIGNQNLEKNKNEMVLIINKKSKKNQNSYALTYNGIFFNKNSQSELSNLSTNQTNYSQLNNNFNLNSHKIMVDCKYFTNYFIINFGGKGSISQNNSNGLYFQDLKQYKTINYSYNETSKAFYTELSKEINKFHFNGGLRYEGILLKSHLKDEIINNKTFNKIFPSLSLTYYTNPMLELNFSYSRKIKLPNYQDLDPNNTKLLNEYFSEEGNPYLKPSISDNIELRSNFFKTGYFSLSYSKTNLDNLVIPKYSNGNYLQSIEQFNILRNYGASFGLPFPLGIITKGFSYTNTITNINNINYLYLYSGINFYNYNTYNSILKPNNGLYYLGINSHLVAPYSFKFDLNYQYVSSGNYMIYQLDKPFYKLDLTVTKSFKDNNLRMTFSFLDIFKTSTGINGSLKHNNIDLLLKTYSDTQRIKIGITYLFGNHKINRTKISVQNDNRDSERSTLDFKP